MNFHAGKTPPCTPGGLSCCFPLEGGGGMFGASVSAFPQTAQVPPSPVGGAHFIFHLVGVSARTLAFSGIAPASGDCGIPKPLPIQVVSIIGTALYTAAGTAAAESVIRLAAGGPRVARGWITTTRSRGWTTRFTANSPLKSNSNPRSSEGGGFRRSGRAFHWGGLGPGRRPPTPMKDHHPHRRVVR